MRLTSLILTIGLTACGGNKPVVNPSNTPPTAGADTKANAVPGLEAIVVEMRADKTHCGGRAVTVQRVPGKTIPAGDEAFVAVLELQFPSGLNFTEGAQKDASLKKFNDWVQEMQQKGGVATKHYTGLLASGDPAIKAAALARMAQSFRHLANILAYAEIPADVSSGEFAEDKVEAFCDKMGEVADPIDKRAEEAESACRDQAKAATGWWSTVCTKTAVGIGEANATGSLDKSIIRRHVRQELKAFQACYETKLATTPSLAGTVTAVFTIDPTGAVTNSLATGVDPDVASCVSTVIKSIKFPKPTGGGKVDVTYPFEFKSI